MQRIDFMKSFSKRLNTLLVEQGLKISHLAQNAGVSYQMARKYTLGIALPDYHIVPKIAQWLNASPGWLLYGEENIVKSHDKSSTFIKIELELLKYILHKCVILFPPTSESEKIINYIVTVIYDATHIDASSETLKQIIDMMLTSAISLNKITARMKA